MNEKTLKILEYKKIISDIASLADSLPARELFAHLAPSNDPDYISHALLLSDHAMLRLIRRGRPSFTGLTSFKSSYERLKIQAPLNASELLAVKKIMDLSEAAISHQNDCQIDDSLAEIFSSLTSHPDISKRIGRCIVSENTISDKASEALRNLRAQQESVKENLKTELNNMLNSSSTRKALQEAVITTRAGRYCLAVKSEYRAQIPGIICDRSASGSTLFIEPVISIKLNNRINELKKLEEKEIERILKDLSLFVAEFMDDIYLNQKTLAMLDFIFTKAEWAKKNNCICPKINTDNKIYLKAARHPLIDPLTVVPIDIYIGYDFSTLIITGPNTGGKTVSLKTVGLLSALAAAGIPVPAAEGSEVAIFDDIFADIGDEQSIEQSLSTFSAHMTNIVQILSKADSNSLCLFDEIGAGTDPVEGAAIAEAILDYLKNKHITTIATTHYSELKAYALTTENVTNAGCEFDIETLKPTYKLLVGVPGKSNAFAISKKLGLGENILQDAEERLSKSAIKFEDLLSELNYTKKKAAKEEEEIRQYRDEIKKLKNEVREEGIKASNAREKLLRNANEEAAEIIREAKNYADRTIKLINKEKDDINKVKNIKSDLSKNLTSRQAKASAVKKEVRKQKNDMPDEFLPGKFVRVLNLNSSGEILTAPDAAGNCDILVGGFKMKQNIRNLELDSARNAAEKSLKRTGKGFNSSKIKHSKASSISPEINLIQMTVDEAISALSKYLDDALLAGVGQVRIIHGMGTGALRAGIHKYLKTLPFVKYSAAPPSEGGDGATIVSFKN